MGGAPRAQGHTRPHCPITQPTHTHMLTAHTHVHTHHVPHTPAAPHSPCASHIPAHTHRNVHSSRASHTCTCTHTHSPTLTMHLTHTCTHVQSYTYHVPQMCTHTYNSSSVTTCHTHTFAHTASTCLINTSHSCMHAHTSHTHTQFTHPYSHTPHALTHTHRTLTHSGAHSHPGDTSMGGKGTDRNPASPESSSEGARGHRWQEGWGALQPAGSTWPGVLPGCPGRASPWKKAPLGCRDSRARVPLPGRLAGRQRYF